MFKKIMPKIFKMEKDEVNRELAVTDVEILESDIKRVYSKFHQVQNEIKVEQHKRNYYEAKINDLTKCIDFYKITAEQLKTRLHKTQGVHTQFSLAVLCYERLLCLYENAYFQQDSSDEIYESDTDYFSTDTRSLEAQIKDTEKAILHTNEIYFSLLDTLTD